MAPRKKEKKPKAPSNYVPLQYEPPDMALLLAARAEEYVTIQFKIVDLVGVFHEWPSCPTSTTVHALKAAVRSRHGGALHDVFLYRDTVHPSMLISADDARTLRSLGVTGSPVPIPPILLDPLAKPLPKGAPKPPAEPAVLLLYDFDGLQPETTLISEPPYKLAPRHLDAAAVREALRLKSRTHVGLAANADAREGPSPRGGDAAAAAKAKMSRRVSAVSKDKPPADGEATVSRLASRAGHAEGGDGLPHAHFADLAEPPVV